MGGRLPYLTDKNHGIAKSLVPSPGRGELQLALALWQNFIRVTAGLARVKLYLFPC